MFLTAILLAVIPCQLERGFGEQYLQEAGYGECLKTHSDSMGMWWASSGWKIGQTRPIPSKKGKCIEIYAAANEAEAAQLVVRPGKVVEGLQVKASALNGPGRNVIPAENVDVLRVKYLHVETPTDHVACQGNWPDPLPPIREKMTLEAGKNQPFWIRVRVPKDVAGGTYDGVIELSAPGVSEHARLRVHVFDFALPDRMTCTSAFGFSAESVYRYQNLKEPGQRREVMEKYLRSFSEHHISPYGPAFFDTIGVDWDDSTQTPRFDWTAWDAAMTHAIDNLYFNTFIINIPGIAGDFHNYKFGTPEHSKAFTAYCRGMQEHLREKGWLDEAYIYWVDEPTKEDYEHVRKGFERIKAAAPDLNRMLTEQVEPELIGGPNIWCPLTPAFDEKHAEERREAGEKFWWYVCTGPKGSHCTLFLDHPGTEMRVWLWQTWQRKIDGILIWHTNWWTSDCAYPDAANPQNPYADPMSWMTGYGTPPGKKSPWGNGDGRFMYPPEAAADAQPASPVLDGPVDSIRWEMLRDGLEDYEYMAMLRALLEKHGARLPQKQKGRYTALLQVPPEITSDLNHFTTDPAPVEMRRRQIAEAIEKLSRN